LSVIAFLHHAAAANAFFPQANHFPWAPQWPYYARDAKPDKAAHVIALSHRAVRQFRADAV
jgi:hypothetical protein